MNTWQAGAIILNLVSSAICIYAALRLRRRTIELEQEKRLLIGNRNYGGLFILDEKQNLIPATRQQWEEYFIDGPKELQVDVFALTPRGLGSFRAFLPNRYLGVATILRGYPLPTPPGYPRPLKPAFFETVFIPDFKGRVNKLTAIYTSNPEATEAWFMKLPLTVSPDKWRYETWSAAIAGHTVACEYLRNSLSERQSRESGQTYEEIFGPGDELFATLTATADEVKDDDALIELKGADTVKPPDQSTAGRIIFDDVDL